MRFHISSFKFFTTLVGVTFVGLFAIANYIRPLTRQDPGRFTEFRPDMRVPLMVSGVEDRPQAGDSIMPEINSNLTLVGLENVRNKLREVKQKAELEKKNLTELTSEANKTDEDDSAQVSNSQQKEDLAVPEVVSQKPTGEPPPVKDEENSGMRQRKISKKVKITFDNPDLYKGPFVEGWPPSKDRYMPHYIKPGEDTFPIRPSKDHFKGCNLLVIVHSSIDAFNDRMGVRDTWLQYVTEGRVENVSVIFLIGNQNAFQNVTDLTKERILLEHAKYGDILQADMVDHYNNLTLKSVFTLKFFLEESNFYSPPPYHVMKVDNDAYLNIPQLVKVLQDKKLQKTSMYLVGHRFGSRKKPPTPIRVPKNKSRQKLTNKWWVPKYLFNGSRYPVILSGSGYVTTRPAATCLFNESMSLPFFHLEDVFLTGFAAENCGVGRYHSDGFHPNAVNFADLKETDILWHYLKTKSVHHMHHVFMYNELLSNYHHVNEELKKLKREQVVASNCKIFTDDEDQSRDEVIVNQ